MLTYNTKIVWCQFTVLARDGADPEKTGSATVVVQVKRDLQPPRFEGTPYTASIKERSDLGSNVFTLRGRDDDKMVNYVSNTFILT